MIKLLTKAFMANGYPTLFGRLLLALYPTRMVIIRIWNRNRVVKRRKFTKKQWDLDLNVDIERYKYDP